MQDRTKPVDWADFELFLAVARGGSLAAAAAALRVDASTVHRRIAGLEEALRSRLFARSPRGYALTNAGQELLPYATAMDEQAAAARRKLAARDEALTGTVRLSAIDDLAAILSPIVASFRAKHPGVSVAVDMRHAFADLARQQADVAVRVSTRAPQGDVVAKHVAKLAHAFYASRAYLARHGRPGARRESSRPRDRARRRGPALDAGGADAGRLFQRRARGLSQPVVHRAARGGARRHGHRRARLLHGRSRTHPSCGSPSRCPTPTSTSRSSFTSTYGRTHACAPLASTPTPPSSPSAPSSRETRRSPQSAAPPAALCLQREAPGHGREEGGPRHHDPRRPRAVRSSCPITVSTCLTSWKDRYLYRSLESLAFHHLR